MTETKALSANERKALERKNKRKAGLVPIEIWVLSERKEEAKRIEKELQKPK